MREWLLFISNSSHHSIALWVASSALLLSWQDRSFYTTMYLTKRRFDVVDGKQVLLLVIPPIFLVLATFVVAIRWHARKTKRINTLIEDVLCFCSLVG
jgi:hypothetical protein